MTKSDILEFLGEAFRNEFSVEILKKMSRKTKKELLAILRDKTNTHEHEEYKLWSFINNPSSNIFFKMFYILYKPLRKKTTKKWLNNIEVDKMVYQNISSDKTERFLGTFSCDSFMKTKNFNMEAGSGLILNTSRMSQKGQHWVALFLDETRSLCYFDPLGETPNTCVSSFIKKKIKPLNTIINNIEFQKKDGTCGDFCITFMINMINHGNYDYIKNTSEEKINKNIRCIKMY
jgi:hypothetical protein